MGKRTKVNFISKINDKGLSRDMDVLAEVCRLSGICFYIHGVPFSNRKKIKLESRTLYLRKLVQRLYVFIFRRPIFLLNIHNERLYPRHFVFAQYNCMIPNLEWITDEDMEKIALIDFVFAKTLHTHGRFDGSGVRSYYLGFTSPVAETFSLDKHREFFHVAGDNPWKGTKIILETWSKHPEWPLLHVVCRNLNEFLSEDDYRRLTQLQNVRIYSSFLPDQTLKKIQNKCLFHLCPSQQEGYGHTIVEGVACGAIVFATDAPPMNELVQKEWGYLVAVSSKQKQRQDFRYFISAEDLELKISAGLSADISTILRMQENGRVQYCRNRDGFHASFSRLVEELAGQSAP